MIDHRLATHLQKRLGLIQGQGIKARGVPGGKYQQIHRRTLEKADAGSMQIRFPKMQILSFINRL
jgi:hypothetical protein